MARLRSNIDSKKDIEFYRKGARNAARELFYDDDILERISSARSVGDIERALIEGRKRREIKYEVWR